MNDKNKRLWDNSLGKVDEEIIEETARTLYKKSLSDIDSDELIVIENNTDKKKPFPIFAAAAAIAAVVGVAVLTSVLLVNGSIGTEVLNSDSSVIESTETSSPKATRIWDQHHPDDSEENQYFSVNIPELNNALIERREGGEIYVNGERLTDYCESVYLSDLTGDGCPELCFGIAVGSGIVDSRIVIIDYITKESIFELSDRSSHDYYLFIRNGVLCVKETEYMSPNHEVIRTGAIRYDDSGITVNWDDKTNTTVDKDNPASNSSAIETSLPETTTVESTPSAPETTIESTPSAPETTIESTPSAPETTIESTPSVPEEPTESETISTPLYNYDCFDWEENNGTITITRYLGGYIDVVIPPEIDGKKVTRIGNSAFEGYALSLTSVTIPDSVTSIGDYAFFGCRTIASVSIPDSITSIGDYAFYGCSTLSSITIPSNIISIGDYAFSFCKSIKSITIPDSATSIGCYAFSKCASLRSVTIPDSVTSIGDCAFSECTSLTSVIMPESIANMGKDVFEGCNHLTSVPGQPAEKPSEDEQTSDPLNNYSGFVWEENNGAITITQYNGNGEEVVIPEEVNGKKVTVIDNRAFYDCLSVISVTIPDSVTSIGESAFEHCTSLISINIPNSVTKIKRNAFKNCDSLTSVTIPNSITSIGYGVFDHCKSLTSVTIPDSVTSIGGRAFYCCKSLASITIPDSVTSIGDDAFGSCDSLTSITIPDSVTSIGDYAFSGCISLTSITIPDSVTSLGEGAFLECFSLTSVTIPGSVTSIGNSTFSACTSLTSITIPDSVTSIGDYAFSACSSLTSVTISASNTDISRTAFLNCNNITFIHI